MSLNMFFWSVAVTVLYVLILGAYIKEMKKRGFKTDDKGILIGLTLFYIMVVVSIWIVYPEGWF